MDTLPDDLISQILRLLDGYSAARLARTSRTFKKAVYSERFWEDVCRPTWPQAGASLDKFVKRRFRSSWRELFVKQPHVRPDGVYELRVTYYTPSTERGQPPNEISYYRMIRFLPNGKVWYMLINHDAEKARSVLARGQIPEESGKKMLKHGVYRYLQGGIGVRVEVDIGHLKVAITLHFPEKKQENAPAWGYQDDGGAETHGDLHNGKLELIALEGISKNGGDDPITLPSPARIFRFCRIEW